MNHKVRKLTEGAMMCALFGMVLLLNRQLAEMLEVFFVVVLPLPLAVYTAKYGLKSGLVCAVSISFLSLMISSVTSIIYSIMSVVIGVVYGALVHRKASNGVLVSVTMVLTVFLEVLCMIVLAGMFGYSLSEDALLMMEAFEQAGIDLNGMGFNFFKMIAVMSIILSGVMEGFLVHMLANLLLKRLKIEIRPISPVSMWSVPKWVGYVSALLYIANQVVQHMEVSETVQLSVMAAGLVGTLVLVLFGYIACLILGMVKYKKNFALVLILLFMFIWPVYVVMGFFYITNDDMKRELLRRRDRDE